MQKIENEVKPWEKHQPVWRYVFLVWFISLLIAAIIPIIWTFRFLNTYEQQIQTHLYIVNRYGEIPVAQAFFSLITGIALIMIPLPIGLAINTYFIFKKKGAKFYTIGWIVSIALAIIIGIVIFTVIGRISYV